MPNGTLTRKMAGQPKAAIRTPPTVGPAAGPANSRKPITSIGARRCRPLAPGAVVSTPIAIGVSGAPSRPWAARAATRTGRVGANAQAADAAVKPTRPARYTVREPKRLDSHAVAARPLDSASR